MELHVLEFREDTRKMALSMMDRGHSPGAIGSFVGFCRGVEARLGTGGDYSSDVGRATSSYLDHLLKGAESDQRRRAITSWADRVTSFIRDGEIDFSPARRRADVPIGGLFDDQLRGFSEDLRRRGMSKGTCTKWVSYARRFMTHLHERGLNGLDQVGAGDIDEFLGWVSGLHERSGLAGELTMLRALLGYADSSRLTSNARLLVPEGRYVRSAPVPALTDGELAALSSAIDNSTAKGKRDLAMMMLAAKMGVRSSEIVSMSLRDIDWEAGTIIVHQKKTYGELLLPAPDSVLDAIADYVLNARPAAPFDEVFLTTRAPFAPFKRGCSLWCVFKPYFDGAGILEGKTGTAARAGLHRLRHTAATRMLASEVPPESIASVLGHAKIQTTVAYAAIEAEAMRSCCLPLPGGGCGD